MPAESATIHTERGDDVVVTLMDFAGQPPTVLFTLHDAGGTALPTAEFTMAEAADLREAIRKLSEGAARRAWSR